MFDGNATGFIPQQDVGKALRFLGLHQQYEKANGGEQHVSTSGTVFYRSFKLLVQSLLAASASSSASSSLTSLAVDEGRAEPVYLERLRLFETFDVDRDGFVSLKDLHGIISKLGEKVSKQELEDMIASADSNADGQISKDEFFAVMKKLEEGTLSQQPIENACKELEEVLATATNEEKGKEKHEEEKGEGLRRLAAVLEDVGRRIRRKKGNEQGLVVHSDYWIEVDGILICQKAPSSPPSSSEEEVIVQSEKETEQEEEDGVVVQGRIYAWKLKPYLQRWQKEVNPETGKYYQETMNFREFLSSVVWPQLSPEEQQAFRKEPSVVFYNEEEREQFRVRRVDEEGRLLDPSSSRPFAKGEYMFVIGTHEDALFIAKKIRGERHHTSFLCGKDVSSAGTLLIHESGHLLAVIARSGHYLPQEPQMLTAVRVLLRLGAHLRGVLVQYQPRLKDEAQRLAELRSTKALHMMACWREGLERIGRGMKQRRKEEEGGRR
ncbi:hypothetical protein QOT17_009753 [Balamuthia mandrillaris]